MDLDPSNYTASEDAKRYMKRMGWLGSKKHNTLLTIEENGDVTWLDESGIKRRRRAKDVDPIIYETAKSRALRDVK